MGIEMAIWGPILFWGFLERARKPFNPFKKKEAPFTESALYGKHPKKPPEMQTKYRATTFLGWARKYLRAF